MNMLGSHSEVGSVQAKQARETLRGMSFTIKGPKVPTHGAQLVVQGSIGPVVMVVVGASVPGAGLGKTTGTSVKFDSQQVPVQPPHDTNNRWVPSGTV